MPAGARSAARRRRRGGGARSAVVDISRTQAEGNAIAELGLAFRERARLVKSDRIDACEPLDGRAALDEHSRRASRAVAASTAAGVASTRAHGQATTSTARVGKTSIAGEDARHSHRQIAGPLVPRKTIAATESTAGRNRRA